MVILELCCHKIKVVRFGPYLSCGFRPTECKMSNYISIKFLALKWAMTEKFREDLWVHKCIVCTDNSPLSHLSSAKLGATEQRLAAQLTSFDFKIRSRSGTVAAAVAALPHLPPIRTLQHTDRVMGEVLTL